MSKGAHVYLPLGHSPDADFVAELGGRLLRVQVKTSRCSRRGRWEVGLATRGGNRSWTGLVKRLDGSRCDVVFAVVADGRRWCIPAGALGGHSQIVLGGPRYERFEVEAGAALPVYLAEESGSTILPSSSRGDVRVAKGDAL